MGSLEIRGRNKDHLFLSFSISSLLARVDTHSAMPAHPRTGARDVFKASHKHQWNEKFAPSFGIIRPVCLTVFTLRSFCEWMCSSSRGRVGSGCREVGLWALGGGNQVGYVIFG